MDAADDLKDVKLYRNSADLIAEIQAKIPKLVWRPHTQPASVRRWVLDSKTDEVAQRIDGFQEWPQLLDSHLAGLVSTMSNAFVAYANTCATTYGQCPAAVPENVSPLPRAVSKLLYTLCKVRGYKVILRLLNNEPRFITPLLSFATAHNMPSGGDGEIYGPEMEWQERYVLFFWLSHLMLAPFDLSSISVEQPMGPSSDFTRTAGDLPAIASSVIDLALVHVSTPGKEREAACTLLVRLALRTDMQKRDLPRKLIKYALQRLQQKDVGDGSTSYSHLGHLSLLYGLLNLGSDNDVHLYLATIYSAVLQLGTGDSPQEAAVRNAAPCRKSIIKVIRSAVAHTLSIEAKGIVLPGDGGSEMMLEDTIQFYLDALSDKDTPVRMAAAKNLSIVVLNLDQNLAVEVIEAILDSFNENLLLEDPKTKAVVPVTEVGRDSVTRYHRNLSSVDSLRWQGLLLALAHLLFRRTPSAHQLAKVMEILLLGLHFEQRSNVGTSVGVGVRDAACFGIWALARKYSTVELMAIDTEGLETAISRTTANRKSISALQMIAEALVVSACLDPSGNIRRGSSAALQELIGRHPDTIMQGISLVQVVDYHAVARRQAAMCVVAVEAAKLDIVYTNPILDGMLGWRCSKSADTDSRRFAAAAIGSLVRLFPLGTRSSLTQRIVEQALQLKASNTGSTAEARHGLLLALAAIIRTYSEVEEQTSMARIWARVGDLSGDVKSRMTRDVETVLEAVSVLINSLASLQRRPLDIDQSRKHDKQPERLQTSEMLVMVDRCLSAGERDFAVQAAADAALAIFRIMEPQDQGRVISDWTEIDHQRRAGSGSLGRIKAISMLFSSIGVSPEVAGCKPQIMEYLAVLCQSSWPIETRVAAMAGCGEVLKSFNENQNLSAQYKKLLSEITAGLSEYGIDSRGDVGSLLRLESIKTADRFMETFTPPSLCMEALKPMFQQIVRLAAEKLDKVRFRAWQWLQAHWTKIEDCPEVPTYRVSHVVDVAAEAYYASLLALVQVSWLRKPLTLGLASSAAAGTENASRASCSAIFGFLQSQTQAVRMSLCCDISRSLVEQLSENTAGEDRNVIPYMDLLALLLDQESVRLNAAFAEQPFEIWAVLQKVHTPSSSLPRIESLLRVYSGLYRCQEYRARASERISRMLLHKYPRARNLAADTLSFCTQAKDLLTCDWNDPVTDLKPAVVALRKNLGIAGLQPSRAS